MSSLARIDELEKKFAESPRRFFAPLANEYRKAGDPTRAIELCRTHLEQQPNHMSGQVVLGQALFDAGFKQEAREAFELALSLDPENLIALRHLGDMSKEIGDYAAAKKWYMQVLDVDSRNHEVMTVLREIDENISAGVFPTPGSGEPVVTPVATTAPDTSATEPAVASDVPEQMVAAAEAIAEPQPHLETSPEIEAASDAPEEVVAAEEFSQMAEASTAVEETVAAAATEPEPAHADEVAEEQVALDAEPDSSVVEAAAEFWSAEESVSEESVSEESEEVTASASEHDPFSWLESEQSRDASPEDAVAEVKAAPAPVEAVAEPAVHEDKDAAVSQEPAPAFEPPMDAQPAEAAAQDDVAASQPEEEDETDDALAWEMEAHSLEIDAPVKEDLKSEWVAEFDVATDPEEIETQREVAASLDWPDSVRPESAEQGAADMSHMDVLEGGEDEEGQAEAGAIAPTPAIFITETMAQLYEQQGYLEMSAAVYRQLSERHPENGLFRDRIADLDRRIAGRVEPLRGRKSAAAEEGDSARDFFSSLVRVPLRPRLARPYVSIRPEGDQDSEGASIAQTGSPAREANNVLSLESVFRNGGAGRSGSGSTGFSFDQFFVSGGQAPPSGGGAEREPRAARQRRGQDSEEIEQFNSWLEGLKRS